VVCACHILDRVLNEPEARDTGRIERLVIGAIGVAHGQRVHADILKGLHPSVEDRVDCFVLLRVNTGNLADTVVDVWKPGPPAAARLEQLSIAVVSANCEIPQRLERSSNA